ncbi:MAG TPA: RimK family alpha-L-glutamate ligase [Gemmataceae bacterium]|nr:RimK family alpha-L-glutamate ligase [Gemmataceae bacterium]
MRFAILSAGAGWHVRDLQRAAELLQQEASAVDFRRICAAIPASLDSLANFDGVLVRTMPPGSLEQVIFRMDALQRVRAAGIPVLNPPAAVEACVDKYLASARLAGAGLPVPRTIVCQHADAALEAFTALGGDVVVKPLFGSEGRGMMRITDADLAWRTFRTLERLQSVLYLQQYVHHPGWDLRAFVLNGRVIAAMRRRSNGGWRTNVAQGGTGEPVQLGADEERLALRAAEILGAPVAGVDLLPGPAGELYVLEVNAVPGWRALSAVTGVDIAVMLIRFLAMEYRSG